MSWNITNGECLQELQKIEDETVDAIICDPPYPEISRDYGRMSEADWHELMRGVVTHSRRILKPHGSAVFILQPNSERVGRMRTWLWEFMAWTAKEWNQVQDIWWWNHSSPPTAHCHRDKGLCRPSVKACVWLGDPDCYRNQDQVLWLESMANMKDRLNRKDAETLVRMPSGQTWRRARATAAAVERGGVTPFNLLPISNADSQRSSGALGHGAGTPYRLCEWWVKYITRPDDLVVDPFCGAGSVGEAATRMGRRYLGTEVVPEYCQMAITRIGRANGIHEIETKDGEKVTISQGSLLHGLVE